VNCFDGRIASIQLRIVYAAASSRPVSATDAAKFGSVPLSDIKSNVSPLLLRPLRFWLRGGRSHI
jgi:hypothetical protein